MEESENKVYREFPMKIGMRLGLDAGILAKDAMRLWKIANRAFIACAGNIFWESFGKIFWGNYFWEKFGEVDCG
jgi:hypothetical protein